MNRRNKIITLSILLIVFVFILLTSYGYLSTTILGNNNSKKNIFKSNPFTIVYSENNNIITGDNSFTPVNSITKSFSVTNPKSETLSFSITLDNVTNTFTRTNDITYTLTLNGDEIKSDVFPTDKTTVVYNQNIESNETLNYVLTINYINDPNENQIVDSGAEIGAKLVFDYAKNIDNILIYGNSVQSKLPEGYTQLEYIESTGTQYIDANINANTNTKVEEKFKTQNVIDDNGFLFGSRISIWSNSFGVFYSGEYIGRFSSNTNYGSRKIFKKNEIIELSLSKDGFIINGINKSVNGTVNSPYNIYIFGINTSGSIEKRSSYQLISFKIYENEIIVRNYIPTKNSNNVVGLYDIVNNIFYTNSGTGEFISGSEAPSSISPIEIKNVGDIIVDNNNINYNKYKISFTLYNNTYDIYLDEPLRKIGDYADYIDIKRKKVVRNVEVIDNTGELPIESSLRGLATPVEESIDVPNISTIPYTDDISVGTSIEPSNIEIIAS